MWDVLLFDGGFLRRGRVCDMCMHIRTRFLLTPHSCLVDTHPPTPLYITLLHHHHHHHHHHRALGPTAPGSASQGPSNDQWGGGLDGLADTPQVCVWLCVCVVVCVWLGGYIHLPTPECITDIPPPPLCITDAGSSGLHNAAAALKGSVASTNEGGREYCWLYCNTPQ